MEHLSMDEFKTLLRAVPENKPWQRVMFLVGLWYGLRVSELTNLRGKDIQFGYVRVKRLKGSLKTKQPYQAHPDPELDLVGPLTALAERYKDDEVLFPISPRGVQKLMERIGKRVNIDPDKMHPHILKHTCAMNIIGSGIENARQRLGHKSIASTGCYVKISDDDAANAINKYLGIA